MRKSIVLLLCVVLSGCASAAKYEAKLNTMIGASENSLIAAWGVPVKTYDMDNGKKAMEFVNKETVQSGGYMYNAPQTTYQSGTIGNRRYSGTETTYTPTIAPVQKYRLSCTTTFIIDSNGKVESWHHDGNNCVSN